MRCLKIKKTLKIWDSSLTIIGIIALLVLLLSYFVQKNIFILMFGQLTSIVAFSAVFFFSYMIILKGIRRNLILILIMIGSFGSAMGEISQVATGDIMNTEPLIQMASILLSTGVILFLNNIFKDGKDIQSCI